MSGQYEWKLGQPLPVLGAHSVAKHDIFEQYLGIYIERLTRTPSQTMLNLTIVDGFSGGGLYRQGSAEVNGSPLRLLAAVETAEKALNAARAKGFNVRADFFFIDANPHHVAFLKDVLEKRGYGARLGQDIFICEALFEEACTDVLAHIQKKGSAHRSLFFLDQYGWSDVRLETIRKILCTLKNPEILLTFAVDALIDFLSVKTAETQALLNIDLNREDVRALTDLRTGEGWRYLIHAMKRSEAAVVDQLPRMIHAANRNGAGLALEELFAGNCNDTPVTSEILSRQIALLRDEGELMIVTPDGSKKPRAKTINWDDRLVLPSERSLFSRLGWQ